MAKRTQNRLKAGIAQIDITPEAGVHLAGSICNYRPALMTLDPLFAKAVALECGGKRLCIAALDLCTVSRKVSDRIRHGAAERCGFAPEAVMVHTTQTHTAPNLGYHILDDDFGYVPEDAEWMRGGIMAYTDTAVERTLHAIEEACARLEPSSISVGSAIEGRMAFNRRAIMRDGSVGMPPPTWQGGPCGPTDIRYIEGPIDPELGGMLIRSDSGGVIGMLLNYSCHPVHVFPRRIVSADWPGALANEMKRRIGDQCTPMVLNGPCGNINPWPPFDPDYVEDHRRMGRVLADAAEKIVMQEFPFEDEIDLDYQETRIRIPFREINPKTLEKSIDFIKANPEPIWTSAERTEVDWSWFEAALIYSVHLQRMREGELDYGIQVFRVGKTAFVGLPGEPFVEGGLQIKLESPTYPTYIIHMINQYVGYIPTKDALLRGGHEGNLSYWSKLAPEALEMVVKAAGETLKNMFQN